MISLFLLLIIEVRAARTSCNIFTARKQSLGKGNVFTGVCLNTGGDCLEGVCLQRGWADPPGTRKASYWNTFLFSFKFNFVSTVIIIFLVLAHN